MFSIFSHVMSRDTHSEPGLPMIRPNSANRLALLWLFSIFSNIMPCWNTGKQCRTESALRPAKSLGDIKWRRNYDFTVFAVIHSSLGISNPFRGIMQPFRDSTHPFRTIMHNTVCWLTDWLTDWLTESLTGWLADWLTVLQTDWFADWRRWWFSWLGYGNV